MSLIAEFTIPPEVLPGGELLVEMPETRIELERIVPSHELALPFFWMHGNDAGTFVERLETEPEIESVNVLDAVDGRVLYRAEWTPDAELIEGIRRLNATIMDATGTAEEWRFQIRAQDRDRFRDFKRLFDERDVPVRVERLYGLAEFVEGEHHSITPGQREALLAAFNDGYFEDPRQTTQEALGERFGISQRAFSERLRRGIRNLVASTFSLSSPEASPDSGT